MKTREIVNDKLKGFNVSNQALNITTLILCAIETDPHPSWDRELTKEQFINSLPDYYQKIEVKSQKGKITTFDFLHWLSENLSKICPIDK